MPAISSILRENPTHIIMFDEPFHEGTQFSVIATLGPIRQEVVYHPTSDPCIFYAKSQLSDLTAEAITRLSIPEGTGFVLMKPVIGGSSVTDSAFLTLQSQLHGTDDDVKTQSDN